MEEYKNYRKHNGQNHLRADIRHMTKYNVPPGTTAVSIKDLKVGDTVFQVIEKKSKNKNTYSEVHFMSVVATGQDSFYLAPVSAVSYGEINKPAEGEQAPMVIGYIPSPLRYHQIFQEEEDLTDVCRISIYEEEDGVQILRENIAGFVPWDGRPVEVETNIPYFRGKKK